MATFVPASTFGRKALRRTFEAEAPIVSAWLLNVPVDTPGDRSTWTWADNWKNFRIQQPVAYTTGVSQISLDSQSVAPPNGIQLFEEGVNVSPGAYYIEGTGAADENQRTYIFNASDQAITFTHYAVFVQESPFFSLTHYSLPNDPRANNYLALVQPHDISGAESPVTLGSGQVVYLFFNVFLPSIAGGAQSLYNSYASMVEADEKFTLDFINETGLYSDPYPIGTGLYNYYLNKATSPFLLQSFKNLLSVTAATPSPGFMAQLLNVTDYEPVFDGGWSDWAPYSVNRYAIAMLSQQYAYTNEQDSYTVTDDLGGIEVTFTSDKVQLRDPVEFVFNPPTSDSFTFTHIAIFSRPSVSLPLQGQPFTHTDPDTFVGVIRLASPVTMTSTSTARAYSFNLGLVYNPQATLEEV
jgi:hypothetical protein